MLFVQCVLVAYAEGPAPPYPSDLTKKQLVEARDQMKGAAYLDAGQPVEKRIADLVQRMTLEEKITYLAGTGFDVGGGLIGETQPLPRLGIPKFRMTDATLGSKLTENATLFPSFLGLAASFDRDLAYRYGQAVAEECRADGFRILLGPGVNIYRVPNGGRNFEYLGEDPYLASSLAVPYIRGVQDSGVIATVKHFVANNCEYFRRSANAVVDDRTLREIYFPAFRAAVQEAGCRALMTSYNPVNGVWAAENRRLVADILRTEWGFDGMVMTDWFSVYDTSRLLGSGVDLEMPYADVLSADRVRKELASGRISETDLDERIKCTLRPCIEFGLLDQPHADPALRATWDDHARLARQVGRESLVLLKNRDSLLPLDRQRVKRIALFGKNAVDTTASGGGAAGFDPGEAFVTYEAAIRQAAGEHVEVVYHDEVSAEAAQAADVAMVFMTMVEHEQMDRNFTFDEDSLYTLQRVAKSNSNTVVVVSLGGGVEMASWIDDVAALIYAWYPGTYGATALGEMLFGDLNPSGKLPISIEMQPEDAPYFGNYLPEGTVLPRTFRGWDSKHDVYNVVYREGVLVGYRWYDTKKIEPLFPFGFGLSYTRFSYADMDLSTDGLADDQVARVRFSLENSGAVAGAEIVQLYVSDQESGVMRPCKELKGFERVTLSPGEKKHLELVLTQRDLSFWDEQSGAWKVEPGRFEVLVGASSQDIRLRAGFDY